MDLMELVDRQQIMHITLWHQDRQLDTHHKVKCLGSWQVDMPKEDMDREHLTLTSPQ